MSRFYFSEDSYKRYRARENMWKTKYGLSEEDIEKLVVEQHGGCAICNEDINPILDDLEETARSIHVDHCHVTGRVRGILCHRCNVMLGWLDGNNCLTQSVNYLFNPPAYHVALSSRGKDMLKIDDKTRIFIMFDKGISLSDIASSTGISMTELDTLYEEWFQMVHSRSGPDQWLPEDKLLRMIHDKRNDHEDAKTAKMATDFLASVVTGQQSPTPGLDSYPIPVIDRGLTTHPDGHKETGLSPRRKRSRVIACNCGARVIGNPGTTERCEYCLRSHIFPPKNPIIGYGKRFKKASTRARR